MKKGEVVCVKSKLYNSDILLCLDNLLSTRKSGSFADRKSEKENRIEKRADSLKTKLLLNGLASSENRI